MTDRLTYNNTEYAVGMAVSVSDGSPRPPERFNRKLAAWKDRNYTGVIKELSDHGDGVPYMTTTRDDYPDKSYIKFRFTIPMNRDIAILS